MMHTRVFTDADNTLWDTDAIYARAQIRLAHDIYRITRREFEPSSTDAVILSFVRKHDQRIAISHERGLGYPAPLLAKALYEALGGHDKDISFDDVIASYLAALTDIPELRPGVKGSLRALAQRFGELTIVTESGTERTATLLYHYGLQTFVRTIVSERKTKELYASLRDPHTRDIMIGDQLDRDIAFSQSAGFEGVHFPGHFAPEWLATVKVVPRATIDNFSNVESYIDGEIMNCEISLHAQPL